MREVRDYVETHGLDYDNVRDTLIHRTYCLDREKLIADLDSIREMYRMQKIAREWEAAHHYVGELYDRSRPIKETAKLLKEEIQRRLPGIRIGVRSKDGYAGSITVTVKVMPDDAWDDLTDDSWGRLVEEIRSIAKPYNYNKSGYMDDYYDTGFCFSVERSVELARAFVEAWGKSEADERFLQELAEM